MHEIFNLGLACLAYFQMQKLCVCKLALNYLHQEGIRFLLSNKSIPMGEKVLKKICDVI